MYQPIILSDLNQLQNLVTFGTFTQKAGGRTYVAQESNTKFGEFNQEKGSTMDIAPHKNAPAWAVKMQKDMSKMST